MTKRATLYARISQREEGVDKVANQLVRLRKLAASSGYSVVSEFSDDDVSTDNGEKARPGFTALLSAIKAGKVDVVVATAPDRFTRGSAAELEALNLLCTQAGAVLHTVAAGVQDPSTAMTRAVMGIQDILGGLEVAQKIERQRARNADEIAQGRPLWGPRFFGFESEKGRVVGLHPVESAAIRQAATDLLADKTLYAIAAEWNASGMLTPRSKQWMPDTVRAVMLRPRNAGWLEYNGDRVNRDQPEILAPEVWESVVDFLENPSRKPKAGPKESALLSSIIRCRCGATMTAVHKPGIYKCSRQMKGTGGHQSVKMEDAEVAV